eukprot:1547791-Rhodomonas_salina.2
MRCCLPLLLTRVLSCASLSRACPHASEAACSPTCTVLASCLASARSPHAICMHALRADCLEALGARRVGDSGPCPGCLLSLIHI